MVTGDSSAQRPITLVAVLHVQEDRLAEFRVFETQVAAVMAKHGGRIERTVVIAAASPGALLKEIHLITFPNRAALASYQADEALFALADARSRAIAQTEIWIGEEGPRYA